MQGTTTSCMGYGEMGCYFLFALFIRKRWRVADLYREDVAVYVDEDVD